VLEIEEHETGLAAGRLSSTSVLEDPVSLPAAWQLVRLDAVAQLVSGGTPSKRRPDWWTGSIPWASPKDLKRLRLTDTQDHISEEALDAGSRLIPAKSLFVVTRGMILARDLPVAMTEVPMAFNQDMKAILPNHMVEPEYLLYALVAGKGALFKEIGTAAHGTRRLGTAALASFVFPLPPLADQRAIAHVLRTLQRARDATDAVIASTRELKKSLLRHCFAYGVGNDSAPTQQTQYGPLAGHWNVRSLSECAIVQTGVTLGRKIENTGTVIVPYLRVANVQDGYLDLSEIKRIPLRESEVGRYSLQPGDVLLTEGGDFDKLGRGFVWRGELPLCVHQNHIFALRADHRLLMPEFLAYVVQSDYGKSYFLNVAHRTTHLACINSTKLKALPVPIPSMVEQGQIVRMLSAVDAKLAAEVRRRRALDALFNALLHNLMTGKIRVIDLPEPEPAEVA
jgi:type I restriction enzyme, S subunit